jgi:hypothetical protein
MNYVTQCKLAARLAEIVGADHEDPDHPRWYHRDIDEAVTVGCEVREDGVRLGLDVQPGLAEHLMTIIAIDKGRDVAPAEMLCAAVDRIRELETDLAEARKRIKGFENNRDRQPIDPGPLRGHS